MVTSTTCLIPLFLKANFLLMYFRSKDDHRLAYNILESALNVFFFFVVIFLICKTSNVCANVCRSASVQDPKELDKEQTMTNTKDQDRSLTNSRRKYRSLTNSISNLTSNRTQFHFNFNSITKKLNSQDLMSQSDDYTTTQFLYTKLKCTVSLTGLLSDKNDFTIEIVLTLLALGRVLRYTTSRSSRSEFDLSHWTPGDILSTNNQRRLTISANSSDLDHVNHSVDFIDTVSKA